MPIVELKGLSYTYPGFERLVLKNVNLTIDKGELVALTGPSGCGKTTLCRCLNGLIPHFYGGRVEGEVTVAGLTVRDHPISELAQNVGLVFQNPENQLFALSVEKDIAFGLENLNVPRDEMRRAVDWAMDTVGILDLREKAPYELSGGQQQRVAIASVLAMRPEVMVLDEPTSFLDPLAAEKLFRVVRSLNEDLALTVILIEHRLDLLCCYTDRIIVMDGGEVKFDGPPREVLSSYGARLVGIGIPKVMRLYQELREDGFELGQPPISVEELADTIRGVLAR
ncbi:MAG: energy-coupling factor ABC transporter ATP-binding protein [Candidatus Bathyarchaeia archaeon]